ncbi:MAG TPA: hypothetical protein DHN33_06060 [Eubacteriaceae bacterium]|nr:hypothetical protein [Eubacteriaceae bacterium]
MKILFAKIGKILENHPIRTLFSTLLVFALLIAGVYAITLSTGNETLVQTDNPVYQSNEEMADAFGSDAVMILYKGDKDDLLSAENLEKIWKVEKKASEDESTFSVSGVPSILNQMSAFQKTEIVENVSTLSNGLQEMSEKMKEVGDELLAKDLLDPNEMSKKLEEIQGISSVFADLIEGQKQLSGAGSQLNGQLSELSTGLSKTSDQLLQLKNLTDHPELTKRIETISSQLGQSATGLSQLSDKSSNITEGGNNTAEALQNIENNLVSKTSDISGELDKAMDPSELQDMANGFLDLSSQLSDISEALATFHQKSDMLIADIPPSQSEIDDMIYNEDGTNRSVFEDVIVDDEHIMSVLKLEGGLEDADVSDFVEELDHTLKNQEFENMEYTLSGKPVLDHALKSEMQSNMQIMVVSAVIIMLLILSFTFKVRWRVLSVAIILISVIATIGLMGWLSVPITMVSMAVFPILIGLGIDYSIQFHNRYEEDKEVETTVTHIGKAVAVAVIATFLGFISLFASSVPMIQDFGKMLTIGVMISFVGSLFLLMPFLKLRDDYGDRSKPHKENKSSVSSSNGIIERILGKTTAFVGKYRIAILLLVIGLSLAGFYTDSKIGVESNIESFMPQEMDELQDIRYVRDTVGSTDQIVLYFEDDDLLTDENMEWMEELEKELEKEYPERIVSITSVNTLVDRLDFNAGDEEEGTMDQVESLPQEQRKRLLNEDATQGIMMLSIEHLSTEALDAFLKELSGNLSDAPIEKATITGSSMLDAEMVEGLTSGRIEMTLLGLGLVFLALLVVYRSFFKALLPLIPVSLIIGFSAGSMYLLGIDYTPITATLGALILGMGTEMTVMVMERYLEERSHGTEKFGAMKTAVQKIGKAVLASGLTTIGGFSVLMLSEFVILKDFGLMTVINISLALFSTLFVLPAILISFDRFIVKNNNR